MPNSPDPIDQAIFLSYASEDQEPASKICAGLRAAGIEVWFDRSELRGGDSWDATIRRQIKTCALFIPIISVNAHSRAEGYFRLEWKLAIDRSHLMATDRAFLVPVVVDGTPESDERIPDRFRDVQWTRLPGGETSPAFVDRVVRLLQGSGRPQTARTAPLASSPTPVTERGGRSQHKGRSIVSAAVLVGAIALAWIMKSHWHAGAPLPYSIEDRRMTFAVLPFQAPAGDAHGAQAAAATTGQFADELDAATLFAHTIPRASVDKAIAHLTGMRELAQALDVHFLLRGSLTKTTAGYNVDAVLVDGGSERVLQTESVAIPGDALTPRWHSDVHDAIQSLVDSAMDREANAAENKPDNELDVRDLSFRAFEIWSTQHDEEAKDAYLKSTALLTRAWAVSPRDHLATYLMAEINLCDCVMGWSTDIETQKAIGAAALDRYFSLDSENSDMLYDRAGLFQLRGRFEESLLIADSLLKRDPEDPIALWIKAQDFLHLGRFAEALPIADGLVDRLERKVSLILVLGASAHYAVGDYATASRLAQGAAAQMSARRLANPMFGPIRLTLAAAEAHLGHLDRAHLALADFAASVPNITTIAAIKKWMYPTADLAGSPLLFDGLRLAGVKDQ